MAARAAGLRPGNLLHSRRLVFLAAVAALLAGALWLSLTRPWATSPRGAAAPSLSLAAETTRLLSRSGFGPGGSDVRALWASTEYLLLTGQPGTATQFDVQNNLVFFVWENIHDGDLPDALRPALLVDGTASYLPTQVLVPANAVHHRYSVVIYPRTDAQGSPVIGQDARLLELVLPPSNEEGAQSVLSWSLPIEYPRGAGQASLGLTWASLMALLGGALASMWPCLFQLTVFFIPSLAGISAQEAGGAVPLRRRFQVVRAAFFFVLGFTLVYTAAGALVGLAAQRLGDIPDLESWRRYLGIGAGIVILLLAIRVAAKARAPLVCKMPVLSKMGHRSNAAKPWELMLAGLAFATGCMTCFGAAVIIAMTVYVGLSASPASGALTLFLFSVGMGMPLVIAATAMAKVLPLLFKLERLVPWMALASSLIMVSFAVLLMSGRYMALANWVARSLPGQALR